MVEVVQPAQQQPLDDHAEGADDERCQDQRPPVVQAEIVERHPRRERTHHVLGAVGEVDDVQQAEDDGEPQAEHGVEGAVDQPEHDLPVEGEGVDSEDLSHAEALPMKTRGCRTRAGFRRGPRVLLAGHFFTCGHSVMSSDRKASSAGMLRRIL